MKMIETWVHTPGAAAVGWTLVHSLWEGAILALLLAFALCFLRSSRARYAAACLAMLGLIAVVCVTFNHVTPRSRTQAIILTDVKWPPAAIGLDAQWQSIRKRTHLEDFLPWLAPLWIAGVCIFHLRSLMSWMAMRRLRRTGVCCAPDFWQASLKRLGARLRLSRPITLLESSLADAPAVIGYFRPVILMPVGFLAGMPVAQIEAILLHELAHIRRYDYLANLLQIFVEGLLFYHPAVWWISGVIRTERENCCDDLVVAVQGGAYEYATALAALEQYRAPREALAATGGSLVKRILRLLAQPERPPVTLTPIVTAAMLIVTMVTALAAWQSKPAIPAAQPPVTLVAQIERLPMTDGQPAIRQQKLRMELVSPYRKWVDEDVLYLITDDERQAWNRLETDEEREKFIEQFWLRRDPTPGTDENEMKEEHYRRIAYANERFSAASLPGWKTDRGRIYITFGPPDEKEAHPSGGSYVRPPEQGGGATTTVPFEKWRYRHIDGIGYDVIIEFVDRTGTGDYRMTTDPSTKDDPLGVPAEKTGATVQVMGNSAVLISIPLAAFGNHAINVYGRLTTIERRVLTVFERTVTGPIPSYSQFIAIRPGSYALEVIARDVTTGKIMKDHIEFEVK